MIVNIDNEADLKYFLSLKNRTIWEEEANNEYFWPLKHQEASRGNLFDRRRGWSTLLCNSGKDLYKSCLDRKLKTYQPSVNGIIQNEVRRFVCSVLLEVIFGEYSAPAYMCHKYVAQGIEEYDRRIKLMKLKNREKRKQTIRYLNYAIKRAWEDPDPNSLLGIAKQELSDASLYFNEFQQHVISAFLITGTIQLSDSTIHCLLSGKGFVETMMEFPANKSLTREDGKNILYLNPEKLNTKSGGQWIFGAGDRRCPAAVFAAKFVETLVDFYRMKGVQLAKIKHARSLHRLIPFCTEGNPGPMKSWLREQSNYCLNAVALGIIVLCRVCFRQGGKV